MAGTLITDTVKSSTSGPAAFQNTSGVEIGQLCRAWVSFAGSTATIRASFNVSSVTRTGVGAYTVNFTNAMADANYSNVVSSSSTTFFITTAAAGSASMNTFSTAWASADSSVVNMAVFR